MNTEIFNKLIKLLNLSKGGTQNEAEIALEKAQAIAAEHGIDLAVVALQGGEPEKIEMVEQSVEANKRVNVLQKYANWIIQSHFHVWVIYKGSRNEGRNISFLGDKKDVDFALYLNSYIQEEFERRWKYYKDTNNLPVSYRATYTYNLYRGLDSKLTESNTKVTSEKFDSYAPDMKEKVKNKYEMILSDKKSKIKQFVSSCFPSLRSSSTRINDKGGSVGSDAFTEGTTMNLSRPIGGQLAIT